ncbi:hypothetical protein GCM10009836_57090 [Pseudonocardia ailaonensis]|uniref:GerMN domain-containing protein n=1 Tax=Pseudonocardia ailaonensis TaxID=367279 RepID=A0ABN2NIK6_9PSEU
MTGGPARCRLLATACLLVLLGGCAGTSDADDRRIPPPPVPTATGVPGASGVVVWFVGDTPAGERLFRERRALTDREPADPVGLAVTTMLDGRAQDPDYRSDWPAGVALRSPVTRADGMLTVDLAVAGPLRGPAGLALQQLVHTVQDAAGSDDPVRVLVGGEPAATLLGEPVSAPLTRADPYSVRSLVQVDDPAEGAPVRSPLVVTGEAAVFEATVLWELRDRSGRVVVAGAGTTAEGQRFAPYRFEVRAAPGEYDLVVSEDDPSGGAGRGPMVDTKRVTVR